MQDRNSTIQLAALVLLASVCFLPFLNKDVTYDDVIFLDYAQRLTYNPARCEVSDYLFQGMLLKDFVVFESTHPPLVPMWIKLWRAVFGDSMTLLHLGFLPFLWLACFGLGDLIQRLTGHSPLFAAGIVLGPLFLPGAATLMADVPLFAFFTAALACFSRALDRDRFGIWDVLAAACTFGACFTAYQGLGLIPLLLIMGFMRKPGRTLFVIGMGLLPMVVWLLSVVSNHGIVPFFTQPRVELSIAGEVGKGMAPDNIWVKARVLLLYIGGGLGFFLLRDLFQGGLRRGFAILLGLAGWALFLTAGLFGVDGIQAFPWLLFTLGLWTIPLILHAVKGVLSDPLQRGFYLLILAWAMGFIVFQVFLAAFAAPRYILLVPAALLLLMLSKHENPVPGHMAAVPLTILLGLLVGWADKDYARAQRIDGLELPVSGPVYFAGEKGVKYSGLKAGYRYYWDQVADEVGFLLVPDEVDRIPIKPGLLENAEVLATYPVPAQLPVRVMNRAAQTGFYIHTRGPLPFSFSRERLETYTLYRVFQDGGRTWPLTENPSYLTVGPILPDAPVTADFTAPLDGLTAVKLNMATHARVNQSHLTVRLIQDPEGVATTVFQQTLNAAEVQDNQWRKLTFPPQDSKARVYRLELSTTDATADTAVTVWVDASAAETWSLAGQPKAGGLGYLLQFAPGSGTNP